MHMCMHMEDEHVHVHVHVMCMQCMYSRRRCGEMQVKSR